MTPFERTLHLILFSIFLSLLGCTGARISTSSFKTTATSNPRVESGEAPLTVPADHPVVPTALDPVGSLVVEEYPIAANDVYTPDRLEFSRLVSSEVRNKRAAYRNLPPDKAVESTNLVLARYGYRLEHDPLRSSYSYLLFKDNRQILDGVGVSPWHPISVNKSSDDFALYLSSAKNGDRILRRNSVERWSPRDLTCTAPVLFGSDLALACFQDSLVPLLSGRVAVEQGDKVIFATPAEWNPGNPIKGLSTWHGQWVLEADGTVFVDGENLNARNRYDEIFEWRLLHGEPFYFFRRGEQVGMSYAGEVLPYRYSEVVHYRCCEPAAFNPGRTENMIWFYARRGGMWLYIEAGVYN